MRIRSRLHLLQCLAALTLMHSAAGWSAADCLLAPAGLISWWPGNGDANDIVGTNHGTPNAGADFAPGMVGDAFRFDGVDDFVQAPTAGLPNGNANRTLEFWTRVNVFASGEAFMAGYGDFGSFGQTYHIGTAGNMLFFSQWGEALFGPALTAGVWYHIAVTNDGNDVALYVNGELVNSGTLFIDTPGGTSFYMGRIPGTLGNTRRLNGMVDEVSVYKRALDSSEIFAIYQAGSSGKCFSAVPEPSSVTLTGIAAILMLAWQRRRRREVVPKTSPAKVTDNSQG